MLSRSSVIGPGGNPFPVFRNCPIFGQFRPYTDLASKAERISPPEETDRPYRGIASADRSPEAENEVKERSG
jgi:hypothetical protein